MSLFVRPRSMSVFRRMRCLHSVASRHNHPIKASTQQGFGLFEVLIASMILAVAVAGVMHLHTLNLRKTADNVELQRVYWIVSNAQQRFQASGTLSESDRAALVQQASDAGLRRVSINMSTGSVVSVQWQAWDGQNTVRRGNCLAPVGMSCIQVQVQ